MPVCPIFSRRVIWLSFDFMVIPPVTDFGLTPKGVHDTISVSFSQTVSI